MLSNTCKFRYLEYGWDTHHKHKPQISTANGSSFEVSKRKTAGHFFRKSEG
ncbi:hypothetical protein HMPREF9069_00672 [Atopobium sp. oral taxon 810 str. F0209]|nr:hypothetical protein HMPREF9069_00672 [Atopobium sp. oral taxon 810 str. F0209]